MKITIQVQEAFDATTLPPAGVHLDRIGPDTFVLLGPDNAPLGKLGRLPMSVFARQLGARAARMAYAKHDGGAAVTTFTVAIGTETAGNFEIVSPRRTQDLTSGDAHVADLVLLGIEYELAIRSDQFGPQRLTLELVPGSPHELLGHPHAQNPFGATTKSKPNPKKPKPV